ncbi:glycosyltransferase family 2 protein [Streptomyces liangshanensis]|uniref:Glycosyltransferase family 2 protein n=1 Tax=Streptomyces liangshanensis TaxID=2717324 RepID=A0A6G9GYM1_9ACTN|nr:glycosyltransferase family 2 protein [Streptomyces liangshanensis]QIQ03325.1 glycosyltransferase family 2 protein [Streptomyces liangshanensis]
MPKLSVIVPFRNIQAYAHDMLRSLANNAGPDTEFILVDDCSTDGTPEILDQWKQRLPRMTVIRQEKNKGVAQARNAGLDASDGTYVTFLDGDDWYERGYLDELVASIERLGCDFVRIGHIEVTGKERVVRRPPAKAWDTVLRPRDGIAPAHERTMVDYPFVWAGIYHRRLFENGAMRYSTSLRTAEDREWVWRLHLTAESFAVTRPLGVFYRRGVTTSLTQISDGRQLDFIPAHDAILDDVLVDREAERFLPKIVRTYCAMIAFHMANVHRYDPSTARELKRSSVAALGRMPPAILARTLSEMDIPRSAVLRRLRSDAGKAA